MKAKNIPNTLHKLGDLPQIEAALYIIRPRDRRKFWREMKSPKTLATP
jgi:hypothetical protein